jgi:hypothetical protein
MSFNGRHPELKKTVKDNYPEHTEKIHLGENTFRSGGNTAPNTYGLCVLPPRLGSIYFFYVTKKR